MNWPTKKLGEVCEINPTKSEIKDVSDNRSVSFIPMSAVSEISQQIERQEEKKLRDVKNGYTYFKKGDILFAKITPCMENGKVALSTNLENSVGFASTEFHVLRAGKNILPEFVFNIVKSKKFRDEAEQKMTGTAGQKRVPKSFIENYEIPLPPLEVQKEIVAKLESVLAKISEAKKLRAEARENADNLLSAELHKIFEEGKKKGWEEKELGEVVSEIKSGFACAKKNAVSEGVVHLRTHNIDTEGNLNFDKTTQIPSELVNQKAFGLQKGDVLFNNTNSTELVGKTALVTEDLPYAFSNHLTLIRVDKRSVLPEWVVYVFNTLWRNKYFESICNRWVGQSGINQTMLKNINIPVSSVAKQKKIVAHLDSISQKVVEVKKLQYVTEDGFTVLEQSILSKAFSGELVEEKAIVQKQIPSPFYRNQVNAAIVEQVTADGGSTTEVAVAKYNHLLQEVCGVSLGYEFAEAQFGPFDAKIKKLIWSGLGKNKWFAKDRGMVVEGQNVGALLAKKTNLYWNAKAGMKRLAELEITKLNADKVELLSTVYHSIKQVGSTDLQKVREFMGGWQTNNNQTKADKFTEKETQNCLGFITKNDLHKRLINE